MWDLSVLVCHCSAVTSPPVPICSSYQGRSPWLWVTARPCPALLELHSGCSPGSVPGTWISTPHHQWCWFPVPAMLCQRSPRERPDSCWSGRLLSQLGQLKEWKDVPDQAVVPPHCAMGFSAGVSAAEEIIHPSSQRLISPISLGKLLAENSTKEVKLSRGCSRSLTDCAQQAPGCSASPPGQAGQSPGTRRFVLLGAAGAGPAPSQAPASHSDMSESLCSPRSHLGGKHWL